MAEYSRPTARLSVPSCQKIIGFTEQMFKYGSTIYRILTFYEQVTQLTDFYPPPNPYNGFQRE